PPAGREGQIDERAVTAHRGPAQPPASPPPEAGVPGPGTDRAGGGPIRGAGQVLPGHGAELLRPGGADEASARGEPGSPAPGIAGAKSGSHPPGGRLLSRRPGPTDATGPGAGSARDGRGDLARAPSERDGSQRARAGDPRSPPPLP